MKSRKLLRRVSPSRSRAPITWKPAACKVWAIRPASLAAVASGTLAYAVLPTTSAMRFSCCCAAAGTRNPGRLTISSRQKVKAEKFPAARMGLSRLVVAGTWFHAFSMAIAECPLNGKRRQSGMALDRTAKCDAIVLQRLHVDHAGHRLDGAGDLRRDLEASR